MRRFYEFRSACMVCATGIGIQAARYHTRAIPHFDFLHPLLHICLFGLNPDPTLRVERNVRLDPNLFHRLPAVRRRPFCRRLSFRVRIHVQRDRFEGLRDSYYNGGSFVVSELLTETDTRACVEGEENEGVWNEVRLGPVIEEAVRIELERYRWDTEVQFDSTGVWEMDVPVGPHRSALRCINQDEYMICVLGGM